MAVAKQIEQLYKIGRVEPSPEAFVLGNLFARENRKDTPTLRIVATENQIELLKKLLDRMSEPFWLLYVLVVPRGEGEPGRYQSAETFTREDVCAFLERFQCFFESDSRHSIWIKSEEGSALLVYDRDGFIQCYGPIDQWAIELREMGWVEASAEELRLPDPHSHHYHQIFDDDARRVLSFTEWIHTPLREQDQ